MPENPTTYIEGTQMAAEETVDKYLTFQISGQVYGLPISNVIEIVQVLPITPMPELPHYAKGIINMRGRVIPVIDVNLRFGLPEQDYAERTCIIIVDIDGKQIGFVVDEVDAVVDLLENQIVPPPQFQTSGQNRFVTAIGKMDNQLVLIVNERLLLSDEDYGIFMDKQ